MRKDRGIASDNISNFKIIQDPESEQTQVLEGKKEALQRIYQCEGMGILIIFGTCSNVLAPSKLHAWLLFFLKHYHQKYGPQRPLVCHH